jgi:glyoxylase-like metal-dependent hydrolase (beta-lactamase superfamily II)
MMTTRGVDVHLLEVGHCQPPEWLTIRGGGWHCCRFPAMVGLLVHPEIGPLLYDTGYADRFETVTQPFPERFYRWVTPMTLPPRQRLAAQLAEHGIEPGDIRLVLISHLHGDHIGGLRDLPHARFVAFRDDINAVARLSRFGGVRKGYLPALLPPDFESRLDYADDRPARALGGDWAPFTHGFDLLGDESLLAIPLPGHTAAQMGLAIRARDGRRCLLAADACWSARAFRERRLPSVFARPLMHDWQSYRQTLDGLAALARAQPDLPIVPSHCAASIAALKAEWPRR